MTVFDYLVLFILITSVIISTMRGLLKEILSLTGWIIAFLVANAYGVMLADLIPASIQYFSESSSESLRLIIAFVALFVGTRLMVSLLIMTIDSIVAATGLKLVDRGLGSLFGLARGGIIVLALMLVAGMTNIPQQRFWRDAMFRPMVESTALTLKPFLPGSFAQYVRF